MSVCVCVSVHMDYTCDFISAVFTKCGSFVIFLTCSSCYMLSFICDLSSYNALKYHHMIQVFNL